MFPACSAGGGYNIDSLTVGVTADPRYSRMTVVCSGDDQVLEQITKQLNKLVDVRDIKVLEPDSSVSRELILVKVRVSKENRQNVTAITDIFRANVIDVGLDSMVIELTGSKSKLEAFLKPDGRRKRDSGNRQNRITGLSEDPIMCCSFESL